ncbi:MAG: hypothetical protein ACREQY_06115, partial [Candidatus Binatia bacterium]
MRRLAGSTPVVIVPFALAFGVVGAFRLPGDRLADSANDPGPFRHATAPAEAEGAGGGATGGTDPCAAYDYDSLRECLSTSGRFVLVFGTVTCPSGRSSIVV